MRSSGRTAWSSGKNLPSSDVNALTLSLSFLLTNVLLGFGLAMDAFSVSVANALTEAGMRKRRMAAVAGVYALFQIAMPLIGWLCVHTFVEHFRSFSRFIPWIALILLLFIGGIVFLIVVP